MKKEDLIICKETLKMLDTLCKKYFNAIGAIVRNYKKTKFINYLKSSAVMNV